MEEAREFAAVKVPSKYRELVPQSGLDLILDEAESDRLRDMIETVRRMETNTSLYAAGAFAPALILLNQLQFLSESATSGEKKIALSAMLILGLAGVVLVIYRAFYINLKRTSLELLLGKAIPGGKLRFRAFESKIWAVILKLAFLAVPIGWTLVGLTVWKLLT